MSDQPVVNEVQFRAWKDASNRAMDIIDRFNSASDREVIIVLGSLLDSEIDTGLRQVFAKVDRKVLDRLLTGNGPLNNFSNRIDMAYALGLIPEQVHRYLHLIRKIRNDFAHGIHDENFDTDHVKDRCMQLEPAVMAGGKWGNPDAPRGRFIHAVYFCLVFMHLTVVQTKRLRRPILTFHPNPPGIQQRFVMWSHTLED